MAAVVPSLGVSTLALPPLDVPLPATPALAVPSLGVLALGVPARVVQSVPGVPALAVADMPARAVQSVPGVPALAVADMCNGRSFPRRFCYADESQQQLPSKSKIQTRQTVQTI